MTWKSKRLSNESIEPPATSDCSLNSSPVDTRRKLNVHKTFRRRPGHLLNVVRTFNLRPVSANMVFHLTRVESSHSLMIVGLVKM